MIILQIENKNYLINSYEYILTKSVSNAIQQ